MPKLDDLGFYGLMALNAVKLSAQTEVSVDDLRKGTGLDQTYAVDAFKQLERAGHGRFIVGRRGHPSRFVKGPTLIKDTTLDERPSTVPTLEELPRSAIAAPPVEQTLVLMRDPPVTVRVPANLTAAEAEFISKWLKVISLSDE